MGVRLQDVEIGTASGQAEIAVTDAILDEFLAAMEIDDPVFAPNAVESGRRLAPSHLLPKLGLASLYGNFIHANFGGAIFAKQSFTFHAPVWVGAKVKASGTLVEKLEKRGKHFIVFEGQFRDEKGDLLVVERRTVMPHIQE